MGKLANLAITVDGESEFGGLGKGLPRQDTGLFPREEMTIEGISWREIRHKNLDGKRLDRLQTQVQDKLREKQTRLDSLVKKFGITATQRNRSPDIQRIMGLNTRALDNLETEITQKLETKRGELIRLTRHMGTGSPY